MKNLDIATSLSVLLGSGDMLRVFDGGTVFGNFDDCGFGSVPGTGAGTGSLKLSEVGGQA